jgi:hypothetical protein
MANLVSCKKKDTPAPATTQPVTTTKSTKSPAQVSYMLDGVSKLYICSDDTEINEDSGPGGSVNSVTGYSEFTCVDRLYDGMTGEVNIDISKGTLKYPYNVNPNPPDSTFDAFYAIGNYPYTIDAAEGIRILIKDLNNVTWSTSLGTADQTGSSFSITKSKGVTYNDKKMDTKGYYEEVEFSFSCKLYDGNGNVKTLTNGLFSGSAWAWSN